MRVSSLFLVGLLCASDGFAQTSTQSVQRTANPELVGILANALGGTPQQAEGAAGSLFSAAKGRMKAADWSQTMMGLGTCSSCAMALAKSRPAPIQRLAPSEEVNP